MQEKTAIKRRFLSDEELLMLASYLKHRLESKLPLFDDFEKAIQACENELQFPVTKSNIIRAARLADKETQYEPYRSFVYVKRSPRGVNKKKEAAEAKRQARMLKKEQKKTKTKVTISKASDDHQTEAKEITEPVSVVMQRMDNQLQNLTSQFTLLNTSVNTLLSKMDLLLIQKSVNDYSPTFPPVDFIR